MAKTRMEVVEVAVQKDWSLVDMIDKDTLLDHLPYLRGHLAQEVC